MEEAFFGVNVQSTLALGEARGVALFVAAEHGLPVTGYPPATVKQTVVGHGRATKEQVGYLVRALLALRRTPEPDAADALAIAICHARRQGLARRSRREEPRVIAFLRGRVLDSDGEAAVVDVGGVGYQVLVSAADRGGAAGRGRRGAALRPHALRQGRAAAALRLRRRRRAAAVPDADRRPGGGAARRARASWPGSRAAELVRAIATGDVARLTQVKGVGRKIAERLALELREKILTVPAGKGMAAAAVAGGAGRARARRARSATSTARSCSSSTSRARSSRCSRGWTRPGRSPTSCARRWRALRRK